MDRLVDMVNRHIISLVLNAHLPYIRSGPDAGEGERWFFEALSETYLPLLAVFDRLEGGYIPFRLGLSISPSFCHMLKDEGFQQKFLEYIDKQIEFGLRELERTEGQKEQQNLAKMYYDRAVDQRIAFTERYGGDILKVFDFYQRKGKLELLATGATHPFLPFLTPYPEAIQAQIEVSIAFYRRHFGKYPQGFWLPELGWTPELETWLRAYNFGYTIVEPHGLVFGKPFASRGTFFPAKTPGGVFILARNYYAGETVSLMAGEEVYRDNSRDAGYELGARRLGPFLGAGGIRTATGFKYWNSASRQDEQPVYDPQKASEKVMEHARLFLETQSARLAEAAKYMEEPPLSLCAFEADEFGRLWYEGPQFIEALFRLSAGYREIQFMTPAEYLFKQDSAVFQTLIPELSSRGSSGYAEMWLDSSNDWMYRHLIRSLDRMVELAERFPDDTGLKERALNQAAREILLAAASDWPKMLYNGDSVEYARLQIEEALRNFTTIYEALGSNYISTEWLTNLEKRHNLFPYINYRVFRRKR
jgi:1,4-alpha-glucan branching enzyme